jgi:hypothetical protein
MTRYKVIWDNGAEACGSFPYVFNTEQEAEDFGRNWQHEMCAIDGLDPDSDDPGYTYEVTEIEDEPDNEEAEAAHEQSLDYFNRYIAGDR